MGRRGRILIGIGVVVLISVLIAEAVESDLAVVVIGARRSASATMAAPLGDRVVLDLQQGTPVAVVLAP